MKDKINRREFIANTVTVGIGACLAAGAVSELASAKEKAWKYPENKDVPPERCPYFDQPLLCCGDRFCEK
jgi:hypothetical protein